MKGHSLLAGRYARALFETAAADTRIMVEKDLLQCLTLWQELPEFREFLKNPTIAESVKSNFLNQLSWQTPETRSMLVLLIANRRIDLLEEVIEHFRTLLDAFNHRGRGTIALPFGNMDMSRAQIIQLMKQHTGLERLELQETVDPDLVGGFVVTIKDTIIDASVKGAIKNYVETVAARE